MKKITFILLIIITFSSFANDTTKFAKRYNLGLGFSTHSLIDMKFEYVTPLLKNRLSVDLILSGGKINFSTNSQKIFTTYLGVNYYFFKLNKSLFIGLGSGFSVEEYILYDYNNYYDDNFEQKQLDLFFKTEYFFIKLKTGYKFVINRFQIVPEIGCIYRGNVKLIAAKDIYEDGNSDDTNSEINFNNFLPVIGISLIYNL